MNIFVITHLAGKENVCVFPNASPLMPVSSFRVTFLSKTACRNRKKAKTMNKFPGSEWFQQVMGQCCPRCVHLEEVFCQEAFLPTDTGMYHLRLLVHTRKRRRDSEFVTPCTNQSTSQRTRQKKRLLLIADFLQLCCSDSLPHKQQREGLQKAQGELW